MIAMPRNCSRFAVRSVELSGFLSLHHAAYRAAATARRF